MRKILIIGSCILVIFVILFLYYYYKWSPVWQLEEEHPAYNVIHSDGDTLHVAVIGDSWAAIHSEIKADTMLESRLINLTGRPVIVKSKGKGGEISKGIYQLMFKSEGHGTKPIISSGLDYCVISAGINDAANNLGSSNYCHHMRLILRFLLSNGIRPVLLEIPDVDIWNIYGKKSVKYIIGDYMRSLMTGSGMYHYAEYREALLSMLEGEHLADSIVFVPMNGWNGNTTQLNKSYFREDQIHLNDEGYRQLDSCVAIAIANDLKKTKNAALVN